MADKDKTPLEKASSSLYAHFGMPRIHPYISSIGLAAKGPYNDTDTLHVYLIREPMGHEKQIPTTWEGFPVQVLVTGGFAPLGGGYR